MKLCLLHLCAALAILGSTAVSAAESPSGSYLAFACDGSARERLFLRDESGTWVVNQNRAVSPDFGQVVYRVQVGRAPLDCLQLELNLVPCHVEFSSDGNQWETLVSRTNLAPQPMKFTTEQIGFTDAQRNEAQNSGYAWFRFRSADKATINLLQLKYVRLDVRGTEPPPYFARNSRWREHTRLVAGLLMILAGIGPVCLLWRRCGASWRVWTAGAALWTISVALKFGFAALVSGQVSKWLYAALSATWADLTFQGYTGLLTGIFECGIFLVIARRLQRKQWLWGEALALGLGFGAFEAVAIGLPVAFSSAQQSTWDCLGTWSDVPVASYERLLALFVHTASVVMILRALIARQWRWFWASFAYKSAVDAIAAWLLLSGLSLFSSPWVMESVCFAPFALIGFLVLLHLRRTWDQPAARPAPEPLAEVGHC